VRRNTDAFWNLCCGDWFETLPREATHVLPYMCTSAVMHAAARRPDCYAKRGMQWLHSELLIPQNLL
jgi:hypothetical protein